MLKTLFANSHKKRTREILKGTVNRLSENAEEQEKEEEGGGRGRRRRRMEAAVFILSLVDCCALIFLSVYFVSFSHTRCPAEVKFFR